MGKKRKASTGRQPNTQKLPEERYDENVDLYDSEDEFHMQRDEIRLDETPAEKRLKKWKQDDDLQMSDEEEVLGYSLSEEEEDDEEELDGPVESDSDDGESGEDDEMAGGWGPSTKNYYNADKVETEQDAIDEAEEAKRIQRARLQKMSAADFGLTEEDLMAADEDGEDELSKSLKVHTEVLPEVEISDDMTPEDRLKLLQGRYPEFSLLAKEFVNLHPLHSTLSLSASAAEAVIKHGHSQKAKTLPPTPLAVTKFRALSAYLGALSIYFALMTSTAQKVQAKALSPAILRDHPIMETLFSTRQLWQRVKDLSVPDVSELMPDHEHALEVIDEEEDDISEVGDSGPEVMASVDPEIEKKRRKAERKAAKKDAKTAALRQAQDARAKLLRKTEESLQHLDKLKLNGTTNGTTANGVTKKARYEEYDSDESEMEDLDGLSSGKDRKKKSLRFYTSQIAQKANKRGTAGAELGGDADIPYRERLKDRQERLNELAVKRGQKDQKGDALDGDSDNEEDRRTARELREEDDAGDISENDLYNRIAAASQSKKEEKKRRHEEAVAANKPFLEEEEVGEDGKRAIGYKIEKNKGLTPFRKKDVRNPRVKKRRKYDEKMKKLKSVKAVYSKEREGRGGYGGELTGIKTGLVKSIKLS